MNGCPCRNLSTEHFEKAVNDNFDALEKTPTLERAIGMAYSKAWAIAGTSHKSLQGTGCKPSVCREGLADILHKAGIHADQPYMPNDAQPQVMILCRQYRRSGLENA